MKLLTVMLLTLAFVSAYSQKKVTESLLSDHIEWSDGSVMLNDGAELKGLLRYNENSGLLVFQEGADARTLTSRNVVAFEFTDATTQKQRVFYSFPYEDPANNIIKPLFFEVIREFKTFAVLSKIDPIDVKQREGQGAGFFSGGTGGTVDLSSSVVVRQTETIYIMDAEKGDIKPYVKIVEKDVDSALYDRSKTKNKMLDDDLLKTHTREAYASLVLYAKENKLKFESKEDLVKILEYYASIVR